MHAEVKQFNLFEDTLTCCLITDKNGILASDDDRCKFCNLAEDETDICHLFEKYATKEHFSIFKRPLAAECPTLIYLVAIPNWHVKTLSDMVETNRTDAIKEIRDELESAIWKISGRPTSLDRNELSIGTFSAAYQSSNHILFHCIYPLSCLNSHSKRLLLDQNIFNSCDSIDASLGATSCATCLNLQAKKFKNILFENFYCVILKNEEDHHNFLCIPKHHFDSVYSISMLDKRYISQVARAVRNFINKKLTGLANEVIAGLQLPPFSTGPHLVIRIFEASEAVKEDMLHPESSFFMNLETLTTRFELRLMEMENEQKIEKMALRRPTCTFCQIYDGVDPKANIIYRTEQDEVVVFQDLKQRPGKIHFLSVPQACIKNINHLNKSHLPMLQKLAESGLEAVKLSGGDVANVQMGFHIPPFYSVPHLHLHVLHPKEGLPFIYTSSLCFRKIDVLMRSLKQ